MSGQQIGGYSYSTTHTTHKIYDYDPHSSIEEFTNKNYYNIIYNHMV